MRVLFVTRSLQREPGGMQATARLLAGALRARGDVELSVCGWGGPGWGLPFFYAYALVRCILYRGDVIHFFDGALAPVMRFAALLRPSMGITCTLHGLDTVYPRRGYQAFLRSALLLCDRVAAVSEATAAAAAERGADRSRLAVIPWGVPHAPLGTPDGKTLVSVGRQIRRKGTAWFVANVFPRLRKAHPDLRYAVAGAGPESIVIREAARRAGVEEGVDVLGEIPDAEKDRLLGEATLFIMPNIAVDGDMEGFGMTCIEAAARGVPSVAARLEGITDAVHEGETGMLFRPSDAVDACAAVERALAHPWDRAAVQASCRSRHDIATVASRYVTELFVPANDRHADGR